MDAVLAQRLACQLRHVRDGEGLRQCIRPGDEFHRQRTPRMSPRSRMVRSTYSRAAEELGQHVALIPALGLGQAYGTTAFPSAARRSIARVILRKMNRCAGTSAYQ